MVNSILPAEAAKYEEEEYAVFGRMPAGFDETDPKRIQVFATRLRDIRLNRNAAIAEENQKLRAEGKTINHNRWYAQSLAKELGVSAMAISKYERGDIKSIPMDKVRRICAYYGVTPHYLMGYVEKEHEMLVIDESGNVRKKEDGSTVVLQQAMQFEPASFQKAMETFADLYMKDNHLFWNIYRLISTTEEKRRAYAEIIEILIKKL